VEIYDPADDSLIGEFGLTVGGWDNWRAKKWQRCFMVVREPVSGAQFLFPDIIAPEPLLHMELWIREFDEFLQQPKSIYGVPREIIEYAIAVDNEVTADLQRARLMTIEDRLQADAAYQELKTKRQAMKSALSAGHGLGTEDAESDCP
jgi:hypothetical protein